MNTRLPAVVIAPPRLGVPVLMPLLLELLEYAERHAPRDVTGVRVDRDRARPTAGLQEYRVLGSQKRPPSGVTLRKRRRPHRLGPRPPPRPPPDRSAAVQEVHRTARPPPPTASAAALARRDRLHVAPLPRVHHVGDDEPSFVLNVTPFQLPPPTAPGKHDDVLSKLHGVYGHRILQLVLVPETLAIRRRAPARSSSAVRDFFIELRASGGGLIGKRLRRRRLFAGHGALRHRPLLDAEDAARR